MENQIIDIKNLLMMQGVMIKKLKKEVLELQAKIEDVRGATLNLPPLGEKFRVGDYKCKINLHVPSIVNKDSFQINNFGIITNYRQWYSSYEYSFPIKEIIFTYPNEENTDIECILDFNQEWERRYDNTTLMPIGEFLHEPDIRYFVSAGTSNDVSFNSTKGKAHFSLKDDENSEEVYRDVNVEMYW